MSIFANAFVNHQRPYELGLYANEKRSRGQIDPIAGIKSRGFTKGVDIPETIPETPEEELSDVIDKLNYSKAQLLPYHDGVSTINLDPSLDKFLTETPVNGKNSLPLGNLKTFDHLSYMQQGIKSYNDRQNILYNDLSDSDVLKSLYKPLSKF